MARSEHKPGTGIHTASTRQVAQADSLADVLMRPALNQAPGQVSKHQAKSESFDHLKSDFKSKQLVSKHITNNSLKDTIKPMLEEIPQNRDGIQR
ncbi:unnamed protein product [Lupinus luteus]|uniref:Uncharacterized protein n=1 Tax=Lupinus luteus TaxID=3873 RepID=A0AAV1YMG7_LUPLU